MLQPCHKLVFVFFCEDGMRLYIYISVEPDHFFERFFVATVNNNDNSEYFPRIFSMTSTGAIKHQIYPDARYKYFMSADDPSRILNLMKIALKLEKQARISGSFLR